MSTAYITDMGDQSIDVSAAKRKFQNSIIVKQDPNKSGILSFLSEVQTPQPSQASEGSSPSTILPNQSQGSGGGGGGGASY